MSSAACPWPQKASPRASRPWAGFSGPPEDHPGLARGWRMENEMKSAAAAAALRIVELPDMRSSSEGGEGDHGKADVVKEVA